MHTCDHISLQNSQGVSPASHDHIVYSLWRKQYSAHERCSQWFAAHLTQLLEAHKELRFFQLSDEKWENSKTKNKGSREGAHIHHYSVGVVAGVDRPQSDIDDIQVKRSGPCGHFGTRTQSHFVSWLSHIVHRNLSVGVSILRL